MIAENFTSFEYPSQQFQINKMLWHVILQEQQKKTENEKIAKMSFDEKPLNLSRISFPAKKSQIKIL